MPAHSRHQTQWAAQFAVASELCRRNYQVALTLGNHPGVDLMVISPEPEVCQFKVEVKGLRRPNGWIIRRRPLDPKLFFVLAYVPDPPRLTEFFVLTHKEVIELQSKHAGAVTGVDWPASQAFKDSWPSLPR